MIDYQSFIVSPLVGAAIGYITNWLAIKMLFRPYGEKRLFGFKIPLTPGLIPKERARLTEKVAATVGNKLLTADVLTKELASGKTRQAVGRMLDDGLSALKASDATARGLLNQIMPDAGGVSAMFSKPGGKVGEWLPESAPEKVLEYARGKLPDIAAALVRLSSDNERMDKALAALTGRVINEHLGKFMGFFLDPEKIYKSMKLEFSIYISKPENHDLLIAKLREYANEWLERDAAEVEGLLRQLLLSNGIMDMPVGEALERLGEANLGKLKAFAMGWVDKGVYKAAEFAAKNMDIMGMVREKMDSFSIEEAEGIILSVVNRELNAITVVGGVLGFVIGLAPGLISLI